MSRRLRRYVAVPILAVALAVVAISPAGATGTTSGPTLVDREPDLPDPWLNLVFLDRTASNGVIHGITRVLIPVNLP